MINDLLARYYEANGDDPSYTVVRSIVIDGHEVAWMEYKGTVKYDIMKQGREGQEYTGHTLQCECDFTEDVGWRVEEDRRINLDGGKQCLFKEAALHLRHLELRREYLERFKKDDPWGDDFVLRKNVQAIILDLIEKAKAGEFIDRGDGGAQFWGGYYYLGTVADITGLFIGHLWEDVYALMAEKKIGLEGAVIQDYVEPPGPLWEEFARLTDDDGWVGVASLPGHRKMAKEWKLEVFKPDGEPAYTHIPGLSLTHDPVFGPDVDDVSRAETRLNDLINKAKEQKQDEPAPTPS